MLKVMATAHCIIKAPGGIILAIVPIPMDCFKEEEMHKASPGRHSEAKDTP